MGHENKKHLLTVPVASPPHQIAASSLVNFIHTFGQRTMVIYDAILSQKRIIFTGTRNMSITQIQQFMFAASSMIAPPLHGIFNRILPYVPLSQLTELEKEESFLAGVTNPMFLENRKCYDLGIRIDEGKLQTDANYQRQQYYQMDLEFIQTLKIRLNEKNITDEDVRQAFQAYTLTMLDLATRLNYDNSVDSIGMTHHQRQLSDVYLNRTRLLKQTHLYRVHQSLTKLMELDKSQGVALSTLKNHVRTLRIRGWPEGVLTDSEVRQIYKDIDAYLQTEQSAVKLLYLLPVCRQGVGLLSHGLFYDDDLVQRLTLKILQKVRMGAGLAGKHSFDCLSEFVKLRFTELWNEMNQVDFGSL